MGVSLRLKNCLYMEHLWEGSTHSLAHSLQAVFTKQHQHILAVAWGSSRGERSQGMYSGMECWGVQD